MKNLILLFAFALLLWSCSDSDNTSGDLTDGISADAKLTFEVVDSVAIDYLGQLRFCDISPDKSKYLFYDRQRGNFLTTDKQGNTLHEFIKIGDRPDLPSFLADNPVFLDNDRIGLLGPNAAYVYDLDGESLAIVRKEEVSGMMRMIMMGMQNKSLHAINLNGKPHFLKGNFVGMNSNSELSFEEQLDAIRSVQLVNAEQKTFEDLIGLPAESKFRSGPKYTDQMMNPVLNTSQGKVYLSYYQDPTVYVYAYTGEDFELETSVPMNPELFYFDEPKASDDFEMGIRPGGAGQVKMVYGYNDVLYTSYNAGVKEEDRSRPNIQRDGQNISISMGSPPKLPKDRFQYFKAGQKIGNDFEKPDFLGAFVMGDEEYLWFARDITKDEEESDYITFYKVKVVEKK
jgi:hypothetical protein